MSMIPVVFGGCGDFCIVAIDYFKPAAQIGQTYAVSAVAMGVLVNTIYRDTFDTPLRCADCDVDWL